jgi:dihydrofolate synthase/folylpolyglutamate synthase
VLDVAHNEDGIRQVVQQATDYISSCKDTPVKPTLHFVIGMVKDKEVEKVLSILPPTAHYYFTNAHIARALPADELMQNAAAFNLKGSAFDDVNNAISSAKEHALKEDLVVVCGSVYLVGEVDTTIH